MEFNWPLLLFVYVILAFALYGIFHWIEVILGKFININKIDMLHF